jgi:hypothetical protein
MLKCLRFLDVEVSGRVRTAYMAPRGDSPKIGHSIEIVFLKQDLANAPEDLDQGKSKKPRGPLISTWELACSLVEFMAARPHEKHPGLRYPPLPWRRAIQ